MIHNDFQNILLHLLVTISDPRWGWHIGLALTSLGIDAECLFNMDHKGHNWHDTTIPIVTSLDGWWNESWRLLYCGPMESEWILLLYDWLWLSKASARIAGSQVHGSYHCSDVKMGTMASQITSLTIVYSTVYSGTDHRKHQSSTSPAYVRGVHQWPVNSPHIGPVARKMFPSDDVIMSWHFVSIKSERSVILLPTIFNNRSAAKFSEISAAILNTSSSHRKEMYISDVEIYVCVA